jgi:hypothetical protein
MPTFDLLIPEAILLLLIAPLAISTVVIVPSKILSVVIALSAIDAHKGRETEPILTSKALVFVLKCKDQ